LASANRQLADPPEFQLSSTARLGFYVVGRLAQRHGIAVRLKPSPYDGITAVVLLPPALCDAVDAVDADEPAAGDRDGVRDTAALPVRVARATPFGGFFARPLPPGPAAPSAEPEPASP